MPTFETSTASPSDVAADLLIVPFFRGREPGPGFADVARALDVDLVAVLEQNHVVGKVGDSFTLPTFGRIPASNVMLLGLGPKAEAGPAADPPRDAEGRPPRRASPAWSPPRSTASGRSADESARALAEGLTLGAYRFDRYKERPIDEEAKERPALKRIVALGGRDQAVVKKGLRRGEIYGESANFARDLVNTPALDATPEYLAAQAQKMARDVGLTAKVWSRAQLEKGGFGGVLGVGSGSVNEPRMVELTYAGGRASAQPIAITGKGITFDSGGLSIKDSHGMETMKIDMSGRGRDARHHARRRAAQAEGQRRRGDPVRREHAERLGHPARRRAAPPRRQDVRGAEHRRRGPAVLLADVLAFLAEKKPRVIIDSATLTGAAMIALGLDLYAVFGNDRRPDPGHPRAPATRAASPAGSCRCGGTTGRTSSRRSRT